MKLISLNVEMDKHYDTILPFLKGENPDVVCLQEVLEADFEMYERELNMKGFYKPIEYVYHEYYGGPKNVRHGEAIFAKHPISFTYAYYVGSEESINESALAHFSYDRLPENRVLLSAKITDEYGEEFTILTTHFTLTEMGNSTPLQLANLDKLFAKLETFPEFVLCGDFNAPRGNEAFSRLALKFKDNIPSHYTTSIDMSKHRKRGQAHFENMVDGLFTTPGYIASNVRLQDGVSDHMAIVATVEKTK